MAGDQFLEGYSGQTASELLGLETTHRVDSIVLAFEGAILQKLERLGEGGMSEPELRVLAIESLEREVNNGGYSQFFENTPEFAARIVDDLRAIQCPRMADIAARAIAALGLDDLEVTTVESVDFDDEAIEAELESCDNAFYEYPESIESNLLQFIRTNVSQIRLS